MSRRGCRDGYSNWQRLRGSVSFEHNNTTPKTESVPPPLTESSITVQSSPVHHALASSAFWNNSKLSFSLDLARPYQHHHHSPTTTITTTVRTIK